MFRIKFLVIALFTVLCISNIFPQKNYSAITGIWESIQIRNSYVEMIRFYPDHKYEIVSVVASDYSYKLKNDTLITKLESAENKKEVVDTSVIKIKGDTLFNFYKIDGLLHRTAMVKEDGSGTSEKEISGNYYWKYPGGQIALSRFTSSGKLFFRLPRIWSYGTYTIKKNTLVLHNKYLGDQKKYCWVKNKILIIKDAAGKSENLYHKVDYFVKK